MMICTYTLWICTSEFRAMKEAGALPFGQLPVLEVDGVMIAQSAAIAALPQMHPSNLAIKAILAPLGVLKPDFNISGQGFP